eukprot:TRINITY_DN5216_c0_g1_i1.p2 TRINITY_DN5216_c0_g1~~TRINITY_DN5216_c0_g1_i1.p2  ORF type:complete len:260 (+),score=47.14 TRINITY_DN5216_c0_g1_i1:767-1546(+)
MRATATVAPTIRYLPCSLFISPALHITFQDCTDSSLKVDGCDAGVACLADGTCNSQSPGSWECDGSYYNASDGCDCNCGAWDPDCDKDAHSFSCNGKLCKKPNGYCDTAQPVTGWTCDATHYNAHDGCDCACGVVDPDCSDSYAEVYNCPNVGDLCVSGVCTTRAVPAGWTCPSEFYNDGSDCDCQCGIWDPDCDVAGAKMCNCACSKMKCDRNTSMCIGSCGSCVATIGTPSFDAASGVLVTVWVVAAGFATAVLFQL